MSLLALDIGSSRIKALLADWDGHLLEVRGAATPRLSSEPGEVAYPVDAIYSTIEELVEGIAGRTSRDRVDTLVFSCLGTAMVPLDAGGRPLAAALAPSDARPPHGPGVFQALGLDESESRQRTGSDPHAPSFLGHALWWRRERPDVLARTHRWRSLRGYALQRRCGADAEDPSWASRTMLLDLATSDWSADVLLAAGLSRHRLPAIRPDHPVRRLTRPQEENDEIDPSG